MTCKIENKFGVVTIENEVVAKVAGLAAMDCYGIVGMAAKDAKDGIFQLLKKENLTKGISIAVNESGSISIDVHIIVEYGTNITAICDSLISTVKYNVEMFVGPTIDEVNIFVEGMRV